MCVSSQLLRSVGLYMISSVIPYSDAISLDCFVIRNCGSLVVCPLYWLQTDFNRKLRGCMSYVLFPFKCTITSL